MECADRWHKHYVLACFLKITNPGPSPTEGTIRYRLEFFAFFRKWWAMNFLPLLECIASFSLRKSQFCPSWVLLTPEFWAKTSQKCQYWIEESFGVYMMAESWLSWPKFKCKQGEGEAWVGEAYTGYFFYLSRSLTCPCAMQIAHPGPLLGLLYWWKAS